MLQVKLSEENIVTVEAGQHDPNGPELAIIDRAILGDPVTVTRTLAKDKKPVK